MESKTKDNKLIAEFMQKGSEGFGLYDYDGCHYNLNELEFHTSWDWLIPVIHRINEVTKFDDYNHARLHIQRVTDDCINENAVGIDSLHKAVVDFIKATKKGE